MYSVVGILTNGACRSVVHLDELNVVNLPLVVGLGVAAQNEKHLLPALSNYFSIYTVKNHGVLHGDIYKYLLRKFFVCFL